MLGRQIGIGEGLRLHPLGGVDDEDGPFAGREGAGDLVAKVHVPGGVDQVEGIGTAVRRVVVQGDGVGLDGDPPFPLEIHAVEELVLHIPQFDRPGLFEDTVGQGGFTVVDMGDNAEIAGQVAIPGHRTTPRSPAVWGGCGVKRA